MSAPADFVGATGVGAGAAGETGAADGENAGTVNGSSPLGAELGDERACLADVAFVAAACRSAVGLAAVAGGVLDGCVAGAAPVWIG